MRIVMLVEVEVTRSEGKFASREELEQLVLDEIEGADPGSLDTDEGASYTVDDWSVSPLEVKRGKAVYP